MNDTDNKEYVKEEVWKDYKKDEYIGGILVDVLEDMGEYNNTPYKIHTSDAFIAVWESTDLDDKMSKQDILWIFSRNGENNSGYIHYVYIDTS